MSDYLRQLSEQSTNRITALETQISDAENNIKAWKKELTDVQAAKDHVDSKLPKPITSEVSATDRPSADRPAKASAKP